MRDRPEGTCFDGFPHRCGRCDRDIVEDSIEPRAALPATPAPKPDATGVEGASEYERGLMDGMRTASSVCHYKAAFYNATTRGRRMRSWILAKECGDQIDEMMAQERKDWPELHQRAAFNPKVREAERAARDGSK